MDWAKARNGAEPEFIQAVHEVAESVIPFIEENPKYKKARILERITEPERTIMFRVSWSIGRTARSGSPSKALHCAQNHLRGNAPPLRAQN